jgi:hypothetical protein
MKAIAKFLTILTLNIFTNSTVLSQTTEKDNYISFSTAIDIKNALSGSQPTLNKPALDLSFKFEMVSNNVEVNFGYEIFNKIHFDKYTIGLGYHFPLYARIKNRTIKTVLIPSVEPSLLSRWGEEWQTKSSFITIGVNLATRWRLSDKIAVELLCNALRRTDLYVRYPEKHNKVPFIFSNYLKIAYTIDR